MVRFWVSLVVLGLTCVTYAAHASPTECANIAQTRPTTAAEIHAMSSLKLKEVEIVAEKVLRACTDVPTQSMVKDLIVKIDAEMSNRATADICGDLSQRAELVKLMSKEHANPSGVVDMRVLHTLGYQIQILDDSIVAEKATYKAYAHRDFMAGVCK